MRFFCWLGMLCLALIVSEENLNAQYNYSGVARVSFIVKAKSGTAGGAVFMTGNHPALGYYDPGALQMFPAEQGTWIATLKFKIGEEVDVKFTRGNNETEAVNKTGSTYSLNFPITRDTVVYHSIEGWEDRGRFRTIVPSESADSISEPSVLVPKPKPRSFLRTHTNLSSANISPRNVRVYLPPGYYDNETWHYPVLYVLDGMQQHYSRDSFLGSLWNVGELAKEMMTAGEIEELIVVVIDNSKDLSLPYFGRDLYRAYQVFMTQHLKPFVSERYRVRQDAASHGVLGGSRAGLLACALSWFNNNEFGKVIAFSPRIEFPQYYYSFVKEIDKSTEHKEVNWYLDVSQEKAEQRLRSGVASLSRKLQEKGLYVQKQESHDFGNLKTNVKERLRAALQFQY